MQKLQGKKDENHNRECYNNWIRINLNPSLKNKHVEETHEAKGRKSQEIMLR